MLFKNLTGKHILIAVGIFLFAVIVVLVPNRNQVSKLQTNTKPPAVQTSPKALPDVGRQPVPQQDANQNNPQQEQQPLTQSGAQPNGGPTVDVSTLATPSNEELKTRADEWIAKVKANIDDYVGKQLTYWSTYNNDPNSAFVSEANGDFRVFIGAKIETESGGEPKENTSGILTKTGGRYYLK